MSEERLHGTTLKVYRYILRHGPVRVREVQRALNLSSPRLASYHIEKLAADGLVKDVGEGYIVDKVILSNIVKVRRLVVPRYLFYFVFFITLLIVELTLLNPGILIREYLLTIFATAIAAAIFLWETIQAWRKTL
jgi:DNA-binding transcriptional ArsR family regulator